MGRTMSSDYCTCRFCKTSSYYRSDRFVKYGVRHYAHFLCYIEAGKSLRDLHIWQIECFPWKVLADFGLLEAAESILAEKRTAEAARDARIAARIAARRATAPIT